ncbi:MAG: YraN family protein [Odoribacter sp.]|nr:YraN family protein [Odoribacter sp.]
MAEHNLYGQAGEEAAAAYLAARGYVVLERNWRTKRGEVDIICRQGDLLVVVEVKSRREGEERPAELLNAAKRRRLRTAAEAYLRAKGLEAEVRFDLVVVTGERLAVEHFPDAVQIFD